jgi:16S rRNA processing protein RimM
MQHDSCFQLGTFIKKVGTDGRLLLQLETDNPKAYTKTESIFVEINKRLVPFFVQSFRLQPSNTAHVLLEDIGNNEEAEMLIGSDVYLPLEQLPKLTGKKFYYHEIIDYEVFDLVSNLSIGKITDVLENGASDLFQIIENGNEILIPIIDDFIEKIDREKSIIYMQLPEGLVEINMKHPKESPEDSE